ncbi:MAG: DUF6624 domain-containing protein [Gemmataceae bacterium]
MNKLFPAIAAFVVVGCGATIAQKPDEKQLNEELRTELRKRVKEDQDARQKFIEWLKTRGTIDPKKAAEEPIAKKLAEIDEANTKWLKEVVEKHGWPGKSLVGTDGAHDAWLLVQHADRDRAFQKKCLELMKPLVTTGEVSKGDFAYLTDRVLVADAKKQLYGTQFHEMNGKMEPQPIEDEAKVDDRRREMGLTPLTEYRKLIEETYQKKK